MHRKYILFIQIMILTCSALILSACGKIGLIDNASSVEVMVADDANIAPDTGELYVDVNNADETIADTTDIARHKLLSDFAAINDDAIAWITVGGTNIDGPVLQSWEEDDYYASHNDKKESDSKGAMYIEMANMPDLCDFNTVIHGSGGEDGVFSQLIDFENPSFFEANEEFVIYLPDNKLTYEIWAVFKRDNTSLIRDYDFSYQAGCRQFLDDVYGDKVMGKQIRGGWGDANENMFMVTLTVDNPEADKQLVIIGALVDDEQGTINRLYAE